MTGKEYQGPKQWIPGHGSIKQQFMDDKAYRTYLNRMAQELQTQKRHKRASLKPNTHRTANEFGTKNAAGPPFTQHSPAKPFMEADTTRGGVRFKVWDFAADIDGGHGC